MKEIIKNNKKLVAVGIALFAIAIVFVSINAITPKVQACDTECFPPASGYCEVSTPQADIGENVTFTAHGQGGTGVYAFVWVGDDGLESFYPYVTHAYQTSGTKNAHVRITSNGEFVYRTCSVYIRPPVVVNLHVACTANPTQANIGDVVTFNSQVSGGNGNYTYSWTGTDGLSGNGPSVSKSYNTSGAKNATITVISDGQTRSATCNTYIRPAIVNNLNVSCVANPSQANIGDTVTFTSNVSGGNGNYIYSWTGTDGLNGNGPSVSQSYSTSGTKNATVTVTSDGQTRSATCSTYIRIEQINNLSGYCEGRPSTIDVDDNVTWTAFPNGGNGSYEYDWSGDDGLSGSGKSINYRYSNAGTKTARVRITSDGRSITASCSIRVRDQIQHNNLDAYCVANPNSAAVNRRITYTVYPSGGSGSYRYDWRGTDGLYGTSKTVYHTYSNPGTKEATVRVQVRNSNGYDDEVTATCYANVFENAPIYVPPHQPPQYVPPQPPPQYVPPRTGVYLDTIPATGISPNVKTALFVSGLIIWSSFMAYLFIRRKNLKIQEQRMIEDAMNS